jgi:hypothetical protein
MANSKPVAKELINQDSVQQSNRWGKLFPVRILGQCLLLLRAKDIATTSAVCKHWKLPSNLENRLWELYYLVEWEAETSTDPAIANVGGETAWKTRYLRRVRVEQNWLAGRYKQTDLGLGHLANAVALSSSLFLAETSHKTCSIVDIRTTPPTAVKEAHNPGRAWCLVPGSPQQLMAILQNCLCLYSLPDLQIVRRFEGHTRAIEQYTCDGKSLVLSAADDNTVRIWDFQTGKCLKAIQCASDGFGVAADWKGGRAYAAVSRGDMLTIDLATHEVLTKRTCREIFGQQLDMWQLQLDTERQQLFGSAFGYGLRLLSVPDLKNLPLPPEFHRQPLSYGMSRQRLWVYTSQGLSIWQRSDGPPYLTRLLVAEKMHGLCITPLRVIAELGRKTPLVMDFTAGLDQP